MYQLHREQMNAAWVCCTISRNGKVIGEFLECVEAHHERRVPVWGVIPEGV
jgi:hypothetical protein